MDLPHHLAMLETAIEQWQAAYADSPNTGLRARVSRLQVTVQALQASLVGDKLSAVPSRSHSGADAEAEAAPDLTTIDTLIGDEPVLNDQATRKTYRQQYIKCGKTGCKTCLNGSGHGPYWYAYWREGGKVRSKYIGKHSPAKEPAR